MGIGPVIDVEMPSFHLLKVSQTISSQFPFSSFTPAPGHNMTSRRPAGPPSRPQLVALRHPPAGPPAFLSSPRRACLTLSFRQFSQTGSHCSQVSDEAFFLEGMEDRFGMLMTMAPHMAQMRNKFISAGLLILAFTFC